MCLLHIQTASPILMKFHRVWAHSAEDSNREGGDNILRNPGHPAHAAVSLQHR